MKILRREKIAPIFVSPNDTIQLDYKDLSGKTTTVLAEPIKKAGIFNEAVIFRVEKGDFEGAVDGLGGAFLTVKEK